MACAPQPTNPPAEVASVDVNDASASRPSAPDSGAVAIGEIAAVGTGTSHTVTHTPSPEPEAAKHRESCAEREPAGCHAAALDAYYSPPSPETDRDARDYFQKGCDLGYAPSCNGLGLLHHEGRGVQKDDRAAVRLYYRACMGGSTTACEHLADALEAGRGVPKDPAAAERARKSKGCIVEDDFGGRTLKTCPKIFTNGEP